MATLKKFFKKSTCPEDRKPLNVVAELYNMGKVGVVSIVLRYYRVPGTSKVCVELVAKTLTAEALVFYEIFPAVGVTSKEQRLHDLEYAVLIPDWALEGLVVTCERTWVHRTQVRTGTPPLTREGQLLTSSDDKEDLLSEEDILSSEGSDVEEIEEESSGSDEEMEESEEGITVG